MAFKFVFLAAFVGFSSAAYVGSPLALSLATNNNNRDLLQRQQNTLLDSQSNSNEQLRRQDEYLRNIDQSSDVIQSDFLRQQSNRLRDNEYRRTDYLYNNNQERRDRYQNQEQSQYSRQNPASNWWYSSQIYGEPLLVSQVSGNSYPIYRSWTSPYNSRVSFSSPLVSYQY